MKVQVHMILLITSLLLWCAIYFAIRDIYRAAHSFEIIPNLHIRERLAFSLEQEGAN